MSKANPKIQRVITLLETRDGQYHGFYMTRCSDGAHIEAQTHGGESNILAALTYDGNDYVRDYLYYHKQITEKVLFALPYAGCSPDDIRAWVAQEFARCGACPKCGGSPVPLFDDGLCADHPRKKVKK
jgi:hypothetical protein